MASEHDIWPRAPLQISNSAKHLITRFFSIADSTEKTSGKLFAEELFTEDAVFTTHPTCVAEGRDGESIESRATSNPHCVERFLFSWRFICFQAGGDFFIFA